MLIKAIFLILLAMPITIRCDNTKEKTVIRLNIQEKEHLWSKKYAENNTKWMVEQYYYPEAFSMPAGSPMIRDKSSRSRFLNQIRNRGMHTIQLSDGYIYVYNDKAVKINHYQARGTLSGRGRDITVWSIDPKDGQWKVEYDLWSSQ